MISTINNNNNTLFSLNNNNFSHPGLVFQYNSPMFFTVQSTTRHCKKRTYGDFVRENESVEEEIGLEVEEGECEEHCHRMKRRRTKLMSEEREIAEFESLANSLRQLSLEDSDDEVIDELVESLRQLSLEDMYDEQM